LEIEKTETGFVATILFFRANCKGKPSQTPLLATLEAIEQFSIEHDDTPFPYHELRNAAVMFLR